MAASRRAAAFAQIAAEIGANPGGGATPAGEPAVSADDRRLAATEVVSLALRRAAAGTARELGQAAPPGWVRGGDDLGLPVQPQVLREAVQLYDIALRLHNEEFWAYSKGLLLEQLADYAAAVQIFAAIEGSMRNPRKPICSAASASTLAMTTRTRHLVMSSASC